MGVSVSSLRAAVSNIGQPKRVSDQQRREGIRIACSIAKDFVGWSEINDQLERDEIRSNLSGWWHSEVSFWGRQTSVSPKWKVVSHKTHRAPDPHHIGSNYILETLAKHRQTGHMVTFLNVHMMVGAWNGDTKPEVRKRRKVLWAAEWDLLASLAKKASKYSDVIVAGDFNRKQLPALTNGSRDVSRRNGFDHILAVNPSTTKASGATPQPVERIHPVVWADVIFTKPKKESLMSWKERLPIPGKSNEKRSASTMLAWIFTRTRDFEKRFDEIQASQERIEKSLEELQKSK